MGKKKKEIHYQELDEGDLYTRLDKAQADLFKLRFRAVSAPLKNNMEIRTLRREVARVKTFLNQRRQRA